VDVENTQAAEFSAISKHDSAKRLHLMRQIKNSSRLSRHRNSPISLLANPHPSHIHLPEGQQPASTITKMQREISDSRMDSSSLARGKHHFGLIVPFPPESERSDFGPHSSLSPESEESGKHAICSTGLKNRLCMRAQCS
jgi:hypothetical protein